LPFLRLHTRGRGCLRARLVAAVIVRAQGKVLLSGGKVQSGYIPTHGSGSSSPSHARPRVAGMDRTSLRRSSSSSSAGEGSGAKAVAAAQEAAQGGRAVSKSPPARLRKKAQC